MSVLYDYECNTCKSMFEAFAEVEQRILACPTCNADAVRIWKSFGGMLGKNKGRYPYFDMGAGQTFESSKDRDDYAAKRGRFRNRSGPQMEILGPQEFERSRHAPRTPNPMDNPEPDPAFIEQAKRDWDDIKFNRVPVEVEMKRAEEALKDADFLNADSASGQMKPSTE